jgi:hypothetical protein
MAETILEIGASFSISKLTMIPTKTSVALARASARGICGSAVTRAIFAIAAL